MTKTPTIHETIFEQSYLAGTSTELNGERERFRVRLEAYLAALSPARDERGEFEAIIRKETAWGVRMFEDDTNYNNPYTNAAWFGWQAAKASAMPAQIHGCQLNPDMPAQEMRLLMGELSAGELRVARAAIRWANTRQPPAVGDGEMVERVAMAICKSDGSLAYSLDEWHWCERASKAALAELEKHCTLVRKP